MDGEAEGKETETIRQRQREVFDSPSRLCVIVFVIKRRGGVMYVCMYVCMYVSAFI